MSITHPFRDRKPKRRALPGARMTAARLADLAALEVPAAQVRAQRDSGPQQALPVRQPMMTGRPAGQQPRFTPNHGTPLPPVQVPPWERQEWLAANPAVPQGAHPYAPLPPQEPVRRPSGAQRMPTQAWMPEFAETGGLARPYAPASHPLDPETVLGEELQPAFAYYDLKGEWPPRTPGESDTLKARRQQVMSLNYPKPGNASFAAHREFFRVLNELTGTTGLGRWPLPALPVTGSSPDDPAAWPPYTGPRTPVVVRRTVRVEAAA